MIFFLLFLLGIWCLIAFLFVQCLKPPTSLVFPSEEGIKRGLLTKPQIQKMWYDIQIKIARESLNRPLIMTDLVEYKEDA